MTWSYTSESFQDYTRFQDLEAEFLDFKIQELSNYYIFFDLFEVTVWQVAGNSRMPVTCSMAIFCNELIKTSWMVERLQDYSIIQNLEADFP